MNLLIAIINHGLNEKALHLKKTLGRFASVVAIDSGSVLRDEERLGFDLCLPNVFFGGCVRAATALAEQRGHTHLLLWASDVSCPHPERLIRRCRQALGDGRTGVYAPAAEHSFHRQMAPRPGTGLARVSFTDGFCFASSLDLFSRICRDFSGVRLGFGMDIHLGYLARMLGLEVCIDHECLVHHPAGAGYSVSAATREWNEWLQAQPVQTRLFHALARKRLAKTRLGMRALLALPWRGASYQSGRRSSGRPQSLQRAESTRWQRILAPAEARRR